MARSTAVAWDGRRSRRNIHVGNVSVFFRGASWHIYFREGGRARRVRVGPDRAEAERRAAEVNAQLAHGVPSSYGFERVTVEDLVRRWLEHHDLVLRSSVGTVRRYRAAVGHLVRFARDCRPGIRADAFSPMTAEDFVKYLRTTAVSPNGHPNARRRPLRDKGVVFVLGACRSLFSFAARQRHLPPYARNPFSDLGIERMKVEDAKPTGALTEAEEVRFLAACDPWAFRLFFTMAFTGMRPGEAGHLLIEDVDLAGCTASVRNHPELGWRTKTRSERRVYLFDELREVIGEAVGSRTTGAVFLSRRYAPGNDTPPLAGLGVPALAEELRRRVAAAPAAACGDARLAEDRIARRLWREMGAITPKQLRLAFMGVARRIGRPDLTCPKVFRHGMATAMQAANVDPFVRRLVIGHTSLETTGIYTHTADSTLRREVQRAARTRAATLSLAKLRAGRAATA